MELPADRDQQPPQRHVIGYARKADRTEKDRVVAGDLPNTVFRHHGAAFVEAFARPVELIPGERNAETIGDLFQHLHALRNDFAANPVARHQCDPVVRCQSRSSTPKPTDGRPARPQAVADKAFSSS